MYDYMEQAETTAKEVGEAYQMAAQQLEDEMKHIFSVFQGGMSETEARGLLDQVERIDYNGIKKLYNSLPPGEIKDALLKQLNAPAYRARIARLQKLSENLEDKCKLLYKVEVQKASGTFRNTIKEAYYRTTFDLQKGIGLAYSFSDVDEKRINQILANKWSGQHYSRRIWGDTQKLAETVKQELLVGFMTGRSDKKVAKNIEERFAVGSYEARRLVRTESCYIANQAEMEAYREADIEKYRFVATLDNRTSEICQSLDGKVFEVDKNAPGVNCPPMHPFCRSTTVAEFDEEIMASLQRRARDPETGQTYTVPANMTYKEWKASLRKESGKFAFRYDDKFFMEDFVKYNPKADYSVKLDGITQEIEKSVSEAVREVCSRGGRDNKEHLILVNARTGKHSYMEDSDETSSVGGLSFWNFIREHEADEFICVHNHPVALPPSSTDLTTLAKTKSITAAVIAQNDGLKYVYQSNGCQMPPTNPALLYSQRKEVNDLTKKLREGKITPSEHVKKCEELYIKYITDEYTKGCVIQDGRREA